MFDKTTKIFSRRLADMSEEERKEAEAWIADDPQRPSYLLELGEFLYSRETKRVVLCLI